MKNLSEEAVVTIVACAGIVAIFVILIVFVF